MSEIKDKGRAAKAASFQLIGKSSEAKNQALKCIASQLIEDQEIILQENGKDLEAGKAKGFTSSVLDRIMLTEKRINDMASAIILLTELPDPIGETLETIEKDNGLLIKKRGCRLV